MQLSDYKNQFIDGKIDEKGLQEYVLERLNKDYEWIDYMMKNQQHAQRWDKIKNFINAAEIEDKARWERGIGEIERLKTTIRGWIEHNVRSYDDFVFSVKSKAAELPGNEEENYQTALLIRHDQLLGAVYVFEQVVKSLAEIFEAEKVEAVPQIDGYRFFLEKTIETRVFEAAEELYKMRTTEV